jgi:hypothetical protein
MSADRRTDHVPPSGSLRVLSEAECRDLLETTTVGRVAFASHHGLQLIPLNFLVVDGEIFFRTSTESILNELAGGVDDVVFEVDFHGEFARDGWDVTVKGSTYQVTDPALYDRVASSSKLRPWAGGTRAVVIRLVPRLIEGRRVSSRA